MKIEYEPKAGLMYIRFNTRPVARQKIVEDDIIIDLDADNQLVGIEIINADLVLEGPQQFTYQIIEKAEKAAE